MATRAREIMTKRVITVSPTDSRATIAQVLTKNKISGVPVVDEKKQVIGIVSEADLIGKRKAATARSMMSKPVVSVIPDASLTQVANKLAGRRIKRVPVITKGGKLVGIVSRADIVKGLAKK